MVKDLLTILTSIVISPFVFSTDKRFLSDNKCILLIEVLVCLKDQYDVEQRMQNMKFDDESREDDTSTSSVETKASNECFLFIL